MILNDIKYDNYDIKLWYYDIINLFKDHELIYFSCYLETIWPIIFVITISIFITNLIVTSSFEE